METIMDLTKVYQVYLSEDKVNEIKTITGQKKSQLALQRALLDFIDDRGVRK